MPDWIDPLAHVDTRSPDAVCALFTEAAEANFTAACRKGAVDEIAPKGTLLATGDLHDNPAHLAAAVQLSSILDDNATEPKHLTLHEVIHGGNFVGGMDTSHRALLRVAALKCAQPERVHTLLANHELSQIVGAGIVKDGIRVVDAFNDGVEYVYGEDDAPRVLDAINEFIRSMPLALVSGRGTDAGLLCSHSLPAPRVMDRFDTSILDRPIQGGDYEPRVGAAHQMVWGRGHTPEQLTSLAEVWGVSLFVLGHEHAENGWEYVRPNAVVLNSDHARGVALRVDLQNPPSAAQAGFYTQPLAHFLA